ncbi:MAG: glycogen synthase GlgA [Verrucomicrobiota bacterium]
MRILLASSEVFPYSKTGGLADMVGALGKYLAEAGHEVVLVTPLYRMVRAAVPALEKQSIRLNLPLGNEMVRAELLMLKPADRLTVYFVQQPAFYDRRSLYGEAGQDYPDNAERFIFFAKCAAQLARRPSWRPDIVHAHDWQAGLLPLFLAHGKWREGWANPPRTCMTIHNLAYQGVFPSSKYLLTNLPWDYFNSKGLEFYSQMNCLKAGIVYADVVTTVSPRYAREITTEEYGCGLDGVLRERLASLYGILNGVDYSEWKTVDNPFLKNSYSVADLSAKRLAKLDLQAEFGLPQGEQVPLFASVGRLVDQKGSDILLGALEEMLGANLQFVLLGSGDPLFEAAFRDLARRYPNKVAVRIGYDHALAHRIEAAADFFIMPSRFEPCGLNQMYSLRYGTIPIVRVTGGLDDSVTAPADDVATADGLKFSEHSPRALARAIRKALVLYERPDLMEHFRQNGMETDFSWTRTAGEYLQLFQDLLG